VIRDFTDPIDYIMAESILKEKSFTFSVRIINLYKYLVEKKEFVLSKQLLRSGTSIGALVRESRNAESKMDFIHKLGIAQKECDETLYWLELLRETNFLTDEEFQSMHQSAEELLKMIKSSILTAKKNIKSTT
jgi:four helix bundle protein